MAEFHFLRPWWLLLLPVVVWAAWRIGLGRGGQSGWRSVVDRALHAYVLAEGERVRHRRWPLATALAAGALAAVALAGPTWDRVPVPAYRSDDALVVVLDLSLSMDAGDIQPSRLTRARLKLLDLLERRRQGETALVVFSANAFTVTPLTNDTNTIASLVSALGTDIMPSRGSVPEVGLEKAADLLRQSGIGKGQIILVTDAVASPAAFDIVAKLLDDGIVTHVLGVGTVEGAPIPNRTGGFVTDSRGNVVVPQLDPGNLSRLARAGGGQFTTLTIDETDLDRLFAHQPGSSVATGGEDDAREVDVWRDRGVWLAVALLPLAALGFRRGWVYVVFAGLLLPLPRAEALEWTDLWQKRDQQGLKAMEQDAPSAAAELFEDPEWKAAARYRAGQFEASADTLRGIDTPDANYNRGNALARAGQLEAAIDAYDRALALNPDHADAEFNRELVAELLEQQQQQQEQQSQQSDGSEQGDEDDSEQDDAGQQSGEQGEGDESAGQQSAEQDGANQSDSGGDSQPQNAGASEQPDSPEGQSGQQDGDGQQQQETQTADNGEQDEAPGSAGDEAQQAAVSPEDIEDWASEQAAEQWLRRIPQDPGGLLRRKFQYQYQQRGFDQDGNRIYSGDEVEPW